MLAHDSGLRDSAGGGGADDTGPLWALEDKVRVQVAWCMLVSVASDVPQSCDVCGDRLRGQEGHTPLMAALQAPGDATATVRAIVEALHNDAAGQDGVTGYLRVKARVRHRHPVELVRTTSRTSSVPLVASRYRTGGLRGIWPRREG